MKQIKTIYTADRKQWRAWLEKNFDKEKEIWLLLPKKSSGKERLPYNDSVEEALCFGWIDSTQVRVDEENNAQRFTPRNPGSLYSQANKERIKWLAKEHLLHPSVKKKIKDILNEKYTFPDDIIKTLKSDKEAWKNYQNFSDSYKRIRIAYIDGARDRSDEFRKRLDNFIGKTRQNKIIGFGGIDKYY